MGLADVTIKHALELLFTFGVDFFFFFKTGSYIKHSGFILLIVPLQFQLLGSRDGP